MNIMKPVLLWTNPNSYTDFPAQTITVPYAYHWYFIVSRHYPGTADLLDVTALVNPALQEQVQLIFVESGTGNIMNRRLCTFTISGNNVLFSFAGGYLSGASGEDTKRQIPAYIYGVGQK